MKKLLLLVFIITALAGCSSASTDTPPPEGFLFESNGITIAMHAEADAIIDSLGEPKSYFEAESCAFEGKDKTYTYDSFELTTYELNGKDYVASLVFLDDNVATPEGIYLDSTLEEVLSAYGESYMKNFEQYTYESAKSKLQFLFEGDHVVSIEYYAVFE